MRESFEYESMFFSAGMANVSNEPVSSKNYRLDFVEWFEPFFWEQRTFIGILLDALMEKGNMEERKAGDDRRELRSFTDRYHDKRNDVN